MTTEPVRGPTSTGVSPIVAVAMGGRRRRPSGEPPPLPRHIDRRGRVYLALLVAAVALWVAMSTRAGLSAVTAVDDAAVRAFGTLRNPALTTVMKDIAEVGSSAWTIRVLGWTTIAILLVTRRFRHLAAFLATVVVVELLATTVAMSVGRMRPTGEPALLGWDGYAHPSRPVVSLAVMLAGVLLTLVPAGRQRDVGKRLAVGLLVLLGLARIYAAVDHPTDVAVALVVGWSLPVVIYRLSTPHEVFPVSYDGHSRAHLDVTGVRGEAIKRALEEQLGLHLTDIRPFGLEGSAGSTPLRLVTRGSGGPDLVLFAKLYALSHLRSDRWYKLVRTVLYGRLEDEKPFSTVRRLVEYEDHLLRWLRDADVPVPQPYGFVEITPDREYLIVMEFCEGAQELAGVTLTDSEIDDALRVIRLVWGAGVAHRDVKPSNVLLQNGHVRLIDVAFATVRPTPWRQAVDLANMMLTLALCSTAPRVYDRAQLQFAPADIAEAFAATRGVTIPTQLRNRLRADGRDLVGEFRRLAPPRRPVSIQSWTVRRLAVTFAVAVTILVAVILIRFYVQLAGLI